MRRRSLVAAVLASAVLLGGCAAETPAPTTSSAPTSTPTSVVPSAPATPTPAPAETAATCDTIITPAFAADVAAYGWVSWTQPRDGVGVDPFAAFPGGPPAGSIACRYGADPDLATDNVLDLAWSPVASDTAAVQASLEAAGYVRLESAEGVRLALPTPSGQPGDPAGYVQVYAFGDDDIRWAALEEDLDLIQDPRG